MTAMATDREALAWETELDRLELEILRTERLLVRLEPVEAAEWETPELSGPMPEHLLPRAREIHERQARVQAELAFAMRHTQQHRQLAAQVAQSEDPTDTVARYVDLSA